MSKFEVQWDDELDLRLTRVTQAVTVADFADFAAQGARRKRPRNLIWHFAPGSLQLLTTQDLKSLLPVRRDVLEDRAGGRTVVVADGTTQRVLMRWFKEFADTLGVEEVTLHVAETIDAAMAIVEEGRRGGNPGSIDRFAKTALGG